MAIVLRDYQDQIISDVRSLMSQGHRTLLIVSPTGSGKTALTAHMLKSAAAKGLSSWFICHRRELIYQSSRAFTSIDVDHGIVCAGVPPAPQKLVQVCSIQTLANRLSKIPKPRLIIYDECQHMGATTWERVYRENPQAFHIGLTASPTRLDGRGLGDFFSHMIKGPSVSSLIERNFLSEYKAFAPAVVNTESLHTRMGDFIKSELSDLMNRPTVTGSAIHEYKRNAMGKRNIVFCSSILHSETVVASFNAAGIPARHVDGETPHNEREESLRLFQEGKILVLSNVDLFGEGLDIPSVEAVTLLRPTQSLCLHIQQIGRALRPSPGKTHAIILDQAGNIERHGLPDEEREWNLDGVVHVKSGQREPSVKICSTCFAAQKSGPPKCIYCGSEFRIKPRKIKQQDGELGEINKDELIASRKAKRQEQGRAETLSDLIAIGKSRGYKNAYAWAKYTFNGRQRKKVYGS